MCETGWLGVNCDVAAPPTCSDGIRNGQETGVDCGGGCGRCSTTVSFSVTADDEIKELFLDGDNSRFGGEGLTALPFKEQWNKPDTVNLGVLHEGPHALALHAKNILHPNSKVSHPGGLLARLYYAASGHTLYKTGASSHSHAHLRVTSKKPTGDWTAVHYDDSDWLEVGDQSGCKSSDYDMVSKIMGDDGNWVWGPGGCDSTTAHEFWFRLNFGAWHRQVLALLNLTLLFVCC